MGLIARDSGPSIRCPSTTHADSEGRSAYVQHRFLLRPRFLVNDKITVFAGFKGLDNVHGDEVAPWTDPVMVWMCHWRGVTISPHLPVPTTMVRVMPVFLLDFTLWRVWTEIDTNIGTFSFSRMLYWGSGIWQNDRMVMLNMCSWTVFSGKRKFPACLFDYLVRQMQKVSSIKMTTHSQQRNHRVSYRTRVDGDQPAGQNSSV